MLAGLAIASLPASVLLRGVIRPRNRRSASGPTFPTIVVCGTAQYDGVPSRRFETRLNHAASLWNQHQRQDVVILGGKLPGDRFTEAEVGREYLLRNHLPPDLLHEVPEGNDTRGEFRALKKYKKVSEPLLIVTDPAHALRAELIARQEGFRAWTSPTAGPMGAQELLHETGGVLMLALRALLGERAEPVEQALRGLAAKLLPGDAARQEELRGGRA